MIYVLNTFNNASEFGNSIFEALDTFVSFIFHFITSIPSYFLYFIDFLKVYVLELPITIMAMFDVLPTFVQTGLIVIMYSIYISFAFKLIKLIIPFL